MCCLSHFELTARLKSSVRCIFWDVRPWRNWIGRLHSVQTWPLHPLKLLGFSEWISGLDSQHWRSHRNKKKTSVLFASNMFSARPAVSCYRFYYSPSSRCVPTSANSTGLKRWTRGPEETPRSSALHFLTRATDRDSVLSFSALQC